MGNIATTIDISEVTECWTHAKQKEEDDLIAFNSFIDSIWSKEKQTICTTKIENYCSKIKRSIRIFKVESINNNPDEIDKFIEEYVKDNDAAKSKKNFFSTILIKNMKDKNPCYVLSSLMLFTEYAKNTDKIYENLLEIFQLFNGKDFNEKMKAGKIDERYLTIKKFNADYLKTIFYFYVKLLSFYSIEHIENVPQFNRYLKTYKRYYSNYIIYKEYIEKKFSEIFKEKMTDEIDIKNFVKIYNGLNSFKLSNAAIRSELEFLYKKKFDKEKAKKKK